MGNNDEYLTAEEFVDMHYAIYLKNVQIAEEFPEVTAQTTKMGKNAARDTLLENLKGHHDRERALQLVNARFEQEKKKSIKELMEKDHKIEILKQKLTEPDQVNGSANNSLPNDSYSTDNGTGEPALNLLQLFDIDEKGKTFFDKDVLDNLCDQIGDRPLAVISTAGKFRQGKTFWNNVMLKALQNGKAQFAPNDFIGGKGQIHFQGGFERHTKGIMVWPKVFTRNDKEGKELAVVLMDTQGTFDTSSNLGDSAIIFAISLLMSSIKIFNMKGQIDAQDLDALNTFIAFSQRSDEKAGQHFLIMVRDSIRSGLDMEYLERIKNKARAAPDLVKLLDGVFGAFDKVECFMVPRPSTKVIDASEEIMAKDCGDDFLGNLCDCANHVLKNLTPKIVLGSPLTGKTLREYVENLVLHIQSNSHRAICSAFAAISLLYSEKARIAGNETFANLHDLLVRENGHRPIRPAEYEVKLHEILEQAIQVYQSNPLFGSVEEKNKNFADFKKALEDRCQERLSSNRDRYRDVHLADAVNSAFAEYEKGMKPDIVQRLAKTQKAGVVKENHERSFPAAMELFDQNVEDFVDEPEIVDYKRNLLSNMIQMRYDDLLHDNAIHELHNKVELLFDELLEEHWKTLKQHVEITTSLEKIDESIEDCQNLLNSKYDLKKREFALEVEGVLSNVSSQMVEQMLDNYRNSLNVHFKKCEDSFSNEVRHQINLKALESKIQNLHERQAEEKKYLEELQEATNTQIADLSKKLKKKEGKRKEAENGGANVQVIMKMMEALNQNAKERIQQMQEEPLKKMEAENARQEAQAQREMEMKMEMAKERREFEERLHKQENQRRADELTHLEAMQRQMERMHEQHMEILRQPPPRPSGSSCSIM